MIGQVISRLETSLAADSERITQEETIRVALVAENKKLHRQLDALERKSAALDKTREELRATSLKLREHQRLLAKQAKKKS